MAKKVTKAPSDNAATLPIKVLLQCHPEYNKDKMKLCEAFYEGGDKFEAIKDKVLYKHGNASTKAVKQMREERLNCTYYVPHPAGLIEFFLSCLFQVKPSLLVTDPNAKPPKTDDEETEVAPPPPSPEVAFWNSLSAQVAAEIYDAAKDAYLYDRGFLSWAMTISPEHADKPQPDQKKAGALDNVEVKCLGASGVDHWKKNADGTLAWVRYHTTEFLQPSEFAEVTTFRDTWQIINAQSITTYIADRELINGAPRQWNEKTDVARRVGEPVPHSYGVCPVTAIWKIRVMTKLLKPSEALVNAEAALQYALNKSAFSWLVFFTKKEASEIYLSEMAALKLEPTDKAEVKGPDAQSLPALERQCDRAKDNLYSTVQSLALQAPSKDQGDRQSGYSKEIDRASIYSLLCSHADFILKPVMELLNQLKAVRKDSVEFSVAGLDSFDIDSKEKKLFVTEQFLAIPGITETARKWVLESVSMAVCQTAPASVREQIRAEIAASKKPEPPVMVPPGNKLPEEPKEPEAAA